MALCVRSFAALSLCRKPNRSSSTMRPDHGKRPSPLACSRDRILAEKIVSGVDVPGFHRASMDGYAVQAADTLESREDRPVSLRLAGCVPMGRLPDLRVSRGEAAEVSTGSMMPDGADAVVMIEYSQAKDDRVYIRRPVYSGENVQKAGSDISFGEVVLFPGTRIASREMGVLAALGRETVRVQSLKVGVASTGSELVPPGHCLGPGQIYDINTYTIAAGVQECGATRRSIRHSPGRARGDGKDAAEDGPGVRNGPGERQHLRRGRRHGLPGSGGDRGADISWSEPEAGQAHHLRPDRW